MATLLPNSNSTIIYCDGACLGNPGPGAAAWILAHGNEIVEGLERAPETTNNRMEILALLRALESFENLKTGDTHAASSSDDRIYVFTDSQYLIQALESWLPAWRRRGWITVSGDPVKNRDLWEQFKEIWISKLNLFHVRGHVGIPGNERCDAIANAGASGEEVPLFRGARSKYTIDLLAKSALEPSPRGDPYYLSVVNGKVFRDTTWKACEARVKGLKGAKFKKVFSRDEENQALSAWGFSQFIDK